MAERRTATTVRARALVLTDPPPAVVFQDFGNDALIFNMNFWLEMRPEVDSAAVGGDLRFIIEKSPGDPGIVIAFPQRDFHLDTSRPLQVEVVSQPASQTEPAK
jgi:potassium-dependent mechanosensitive channel